MHSHRQTDRQTDTQTAPLRKHNLLGGGTRNYGLTQ